jgi:hypothetical protein
MKDITLVTTFHKPGLDLYGQRFLDSFAENVDKRIKLLVYAEDCSPVNPSPENITIFDAKVLRKLSQFKNRWGNVPKANGDISQDPVRSRRRDSNKAFKWDAVRFANKIYAVLDACNRSSDWCVWIDADTFVHSPWSYEEFNALLPNNKWLTYVGRGKAAQTWPECGFYGLNVKNVACQEFLQELEQFYEDAENGIFTLDEWHDSYVFGDILKRKNVKHSNVLDYSADMYIRTAKTGGGGHPLINCVLGQWIDHLKGDRKHQGRSKASDVIVDHGLDYWQQKI